MSDYTYIVFGESGLYISKLLKDHNPNAKIIHFHDGYYFQYSCADIKVDLTLDFNGCIANEHAKKEYISEDKKINLETINALKNVKQAIIFDDSTNDNYPIILNITKKLLETNICCYNILVEPFTFFGKKRVNYYKDFRNEIIKINNNIYDFSCESLNKYDIKKYDFNNLMRLVDVIQFNIAINLEKSIDLIVRETLKNELPDMKLKKTIKEYTYVSVIYDDDIVAKTINEPSFYYITEIDNINVDDKVLVDRNSKETIGIVIDIENYYEDDVPYPVSKTKKIIKVLEKSCKETKELQNKKEEFFFDSFDEYMLIINNDEKINEKLDLYRTFVVNSDSPNMVELIKKCNILITIGDVNISSYYLSEKYVININNNNNFGRNTAMAYLSNSEEYIQMIKAIHYGLFYSGLITIDLHDIEYSLNGRIKYKRFSLKEKDSVFEEFDTNSGKKIFIVFEAPINVSLYEICDIVEKFRERYKKCNLGFGVPIVPDIDELKINVFYEKN